MSKRIFTTLLCTLALLSTAEAATPKHTVSEDIYVYLRSGPTKKHGLPYVVRAGEALTVMSSPENGYTKVAASRNRVGWIETKHLVKGASFRTEVPRLTEALEKARAQLAEVTADRDALQTSQSSQQGQNRKQAKELLRLQQENNALKTEVAKLSQEERFIWMKQGGIVAGVGLLLGLLLAYIPRPRRRNSHNPFN